MRRFGFFVLILALLLLAACGAPATPAPTSTPAATPTHDAPAPTNTPTATPAPTQTPTSEPAPTNTPEPTATATIEPTPSPTPTPETAENLTPAEALLANTTEIFRSDSADVTVVVDNEWLEIEGFTPTMRINTEDGYSEELYTQFIDGLRQVIGEHKYPVPDINDGKIPYDAKTNSVTRWTDIPADAHIVLMITHQPFGQKDLKKPGLPNDKLPWLFIFGNIGPSQKEVGVYYDKETNTLYGVTNIPPTIDKENLNYWSDYSYQNKVHQPLFALTALGANKNMSLEDAWADLLWTPGNGNGPGPAALSLDMRNVVEYYGLLMTKNVNDKLIEPFRVNGMPEAFKY